MAKHLLLTVAFTLVFASAFSYDYNFASSSAEGIVYYKLDSPKKGEATVVAGEWQYSGDVVIPSSITVKGKDYLVTTIGQDAFYYCYDVKSVTLGSNVKTIKNCAFERVSGPNGSGIRINLDSEALTTIEKNAFHCAVLAPNKGDTLVIGKNVGTVAGGDNFFSWTTFPGVKHFHVDESSSTLCTNADGILYSKDMKKLYYYPPYLSGANYDIPASVEIVATFAFYAMQNLQRITGGDNVTSMGSVVSGGKLVSLHIGAKVESMGTSALMYASNNSFLPDIDEGNKCFEVIDGVLYKYTSADTILCRYFKCNTQETFVVPANVTQVGDYAFYSHPYIKNIDYGQCTKLKAGKISATAYHSTTYSVNFLNSENIYVNIDGVFYSDDTVTMVLYGSDVAVKDYVMPAKTKKITVSTIKSNANTKTFSINKVANEINGEYLYPLENLEYYYVDEGNGTYSSDTCGVLYNKSKTKLISYPRGNKRLFYKVADGTTQVGIHAFYCNKYLQGLDLGDDIKSVVDGNSGNMAEMKSLSFIRVGTNQPPIATTSSFSSSMYSGDTKVILYVPSEAFDIYSNSSIWNRFAVVRDTGDFMSDIKSKKYDYLTYHYKQNIEGTSFLKPESVKCEGYLLCNTTAEPNNYEGFTPMPFDQKLLDNTNIIVKIYYTRNSYTVNWKSKGEVVSNGTYKYGTVMTEPNVTVTPDAGKHFIGWNPNPDATTAVTFDENSLLRKDTTFHAIFATNDRKPYVVRHFLQNLDDNNYPTTPYATDTIMEVFGLQTQATAKTYTGFTAPASINQGTVSEDGNTVVDINYTRNSYDVNWYNGSAPVLAGNYKYGSELVIPSDPPAVAGKHFVGWNTDANATVALSLGGKTVEGVATYYAIFATNDSKPYTVNHYKQNLDGTYPTDPEETETGSGTVGLQTQATAKTYTGFTAPETISQEIIKADGTTVVDIKYTRNSYDVKWYNGSAPVLTGNYKYGSYLEIPSASDLEAVAGKHFIGWNTIDTVNNALNLTEATVDSNVVYYAIFVVNDSKPYVVNHYQEDLDGNYPATPTTTDNGSGVWGLQTNASAKNYEGFTAQNFSQATIKEDGTTVVEIYYKRNIHILTWSIGYGTLESESYTKGSVMFGATIIEPKLNREGYTHKGWSLTNGGNTTVVATQMPDADLTYYDVWDVNEYKVIWDWNYAGSPQPTSFFNYGEDIEAPAGVPDRDKYTFAGWSKTKNGAIITNGDFGKMTTAGATFYAQWIPNKYNLTWNANGGSLSGSYTSGSVDYGTDIVKPNASRTGYTFIGWGESATATSTINIPLTMPGEDKEFFAIWEINQHTLTWNANSGELSGNYTKGTVSYGTTITAPLATRKGHTFKGWTTTLGSTETVEITTMPDSDIVYYALWEAKQHTLNWDANGGELGGTYTSGTVAYGTTIVAPTNVSRTGYKFAGWGESATSTAPTSVASTMPDEDVEYYALWVAKDYVVEWLLNDGTDNLYGSNNVAFGNAISKIEPDPSREHYKFLGWSKTADSEVISDFGTMNANEVKFYAQWQINSNNLSWNANGGVLSGTYTSGDVDYGKEIVKPTATRVGHTFEGWASASDASVSDTVEITTMPDADTTFYAVWSVNAYTVNWKFNDGTSGNFTTTEVNYGDYISQPANNPSFEHYQFQGWSATEDGDVISDFGTMEASDTTFYAIWQLNKNVVVWYINNGTDSIFATDTIEYLAEIVSPVETPSRKYHHFMGWSSSQSGLAESDFGTMPDNDTAFYAVWAEDVYDAIWYMNDGSDSIFLTTTASVSSPVIAPDTVPARANYAFQGWSSTADGEILTDFGTMPSGGIEFYAVWEDVLYDALWYVNNGSDDIFFTAQATVSSTLVAPDSVPSRANYAFQGWSSTADGEILTDFGTMPSGGASFYAIWSLNQFTANWYMNDGTDSVFYIVRTNVGDTLAMPDTVPVRANYEFQGWSSTTDGEILTGFGTMPSGGTSFYAIWSLNQFMALWKMNDGTDAVFKSEKIAMDSAIVAPETVPTRADYMFVGWSASPQGGVITDFGTMNGEGVVFYAIWDPIVEFTTPDKFVTCENEKKIELSGVSHNVEFVWSVNGVVDTTQFGPEYELPESSAYEGTVEVTGSFGGKNVRKEIPYQRKKEMIRTMWDDVVTVVNADSMFCSYKWYHNDQLIDTTEFYNEVGGLTGSYYLVATTSSGVEICSCDRNFGEKKEVAMTVYPNPVIEKAYVRGSILEVGKRIVVTDDNGNTILSRIVTKEGVEEIDFTKTPQGLYIVKIDGKAVSFIKL